MTTGSIIVSRTARWVALLFLTLGTVDAAEVKVMISGGFSAAYRDLVADFERSTEHKVTTSSGASMGGAPNSIPSRLARGEPVDVLILAGSALDNLIKDGKAVSGSRDKGPCALFDRHGGAQGCAQAGYLDCRCAQAHAAGGQIDCLLGECEWRLSLERDVTASWASLIRSRTKPRRIESERVAAVVARGDAEIGFQQVSELLPEKGTDYVGPLPAEVQRVTVFSAGIASGATEPDAANALIKFLDFAITFPAITKSGLEPMTAEPKR